LRERYDARYAPTYDEEWGVISPSHEATVLRLLDLTPARGIVLDAPCGTGKYWPLILDAGYGLVGVDHSAGMLEVAANKHPDVKTERLALQDLPYDAEFDAVICVDAMENVGPEDWPVVLERLRSAAKPGAYLYLTVELPEDGAEVIRNYESARARGEPVVAGEDFDGTAYHYYPVAGAIHRWLDEAQLERIDEHDADEYRHFLLRRPS
jgi:SAM-dependent methyltransferase